MASISKPPESSFPIRLRSEQIIQSFYSDNQKSEYTTNYPEYPIAANQQPDGNARKNNFSIGNQNDLDNAAYRSEFKDKFPDYQVKGKQQPIGAKNVGMNNIVFGYDQDDGYKTNYKDDYIMKNSQNNRVRPGDVRKKNIDFGDSLTDFTTTYAKLYDNKNAPLQQSNTNPQQIDRKSHLMLGNDKLSFQTQNSAAYKGSMTSNYHVHKQSNSSNIDLGSENISYGSENKQRFSLNGPPQQQIVSKQVIRDFRSAHFQFAFPSQKINAQSQAQQQYNTKPIELVHVDGKKPSNIHLNVDGKNYFESSYGKQFQNHGVQQRSQINKHGRKDNILIGTDVDPSERYVSQAKNNFDQKPINRVQQIRAPGSLQLGEQISDFRTHNQMTYDDKFGRRQENKVSQDQINKKKINNVVTGFQDVNYNLHSNQYGRKQGERGQLSKDTLNKMKNTNIVLETVANVSNLGGSTSYKASYPYKINEEY